MSSETKITVNLDGIKALTEGLRNSYMARVGVLGDKAIRIDENATGTGDNMLTNAEIMAIQQFGSITQNIPPRDILILPIESHRREIMQTMAGSSIQAAIAEGDYMRCFKLLGAAAEYWIQMGFETSGFGQWAPNAPYTIAKKGSSKPEIDTGQMRRAVSSDVVSKSQIKSMK